MVIEESEKYYELQQERKVSTKIKTTFGDLTITVGSNPELGHNSWYISSILFVVFFSFFCTALLAVTMVTKREQNELLRRMLPRSVINRLRKGKTVAEKYEDNTVFFSQIIGFEEMSRAWKPTDAVRLLNKIFDGMDQLLSKHNIQKIDTIGDIYIAMGCGAGTPSYDGLQSAEKTALFALDALKFVRDFNEIHKTHISIKIGLSSGQVVAG